MASNYPGSLDTFDTIASDKKTSDSVGGRTHRAMHNDLGDAIESIQGELGTNPSGSDATVAARLTAIEAGTNLGTGAVTSAKIADGTIVNDDINASAAIARSKISGLPTSSTDNTIVRFDSTAGAMQTSGVVVDDNDRLTVATGATGGYGFASGAVHLQGTGSPEGVVTAGPGSTWLQTDSTVTASGWLRWVKNAGTGNTGWLAGPESDTGQRDIRGLLENGWTAGGGYLDLVRVGNTVFLSGGVNGSAATSDTFLTIPTGFRPPSTPRSVVHFATVQVSTSAGATRLVEISGGGIIKIYGRASSDHFLGLSWPAERTWPTSLPGSA